MDRAEGVFIDGTSLRPIAISPGLIDTFIMEITEPKLIYEDGKIKEVPPFSEREEGEYPESFPSGKYVVYTAQHSEVVTIPMAIKGVRNVVVK